MRYDMLDKIADDYHYEKAKKDFLAIPDVSGEDMTEVDSFPKVIKALTWETSESNN